MKKTVYIFLLLGWLLPSSILQAQDERISQAINDAEYIFQGKVLERHPIKQIDKVDYISYKILVEEVYKANKDISNDTVELIATLPFGWFVKDYGIGKNNIAAYKIDYPDNKGIGIDIGMSVMFFMKNNDTDISNHYTSLSLKSVSDFNDSYFLQSRVKDIDLVNRKWKYIPNIMGFGKHFDDTDKFHNYLKERGLDLSQQIIKKKDLTVGEKKVNKEIYQNRLTHYNNYLNYINLRKQNKNDTFTSKSEELNITIENQKISCISDGQKTFFEFDIYASGNSSNTYLENVVFVLGYNSNAFHTNVSANNSIIVTMGNSFSSPTYDDPMNGIIDDGPDSVRFRLGTNFNGVSWNRALITTSPIKLLHVKMELFDCDYYDADLKFKDIANVSIIALYTNTPNISPITAPYLAYNANYVQPSNFALCSSIQIDDFYPKTISAGTNSILTIVGSGFGCLRGEGNILFKDADNGGTTYIPDLNKIDYLSWSDTLINIILPSIIDTTPTINHTSNIYHPRSGDFIITTNIDALNSSPDLNIRYSAANYYNTDTNVNIPLYKKLPYRQVSFKDYSDNHAREFYLDTSISNNPQMTAVVYKALNDWSCLTNINWKIVGTVAKDTISNQTSKSIIYQSNFTIGNFIAYTDFKNSTEYCLDNSSNSNFVYCKSLDIVIKRTIPWFYDTTMNLAIPPNKYDFYNSILYEFGHAHYLEHVNTIPDIMYFSNRTISLLDSVPSNSRRHVRNSPGAIDGGDFILNNSYSLNYTCNGIHNTSAYYPENCVNLSVSSLGNSVFNVSIYPNPFNTEIIVKYNLDYPSDIYCTITDITGKVLKLTTFNNSTKGENSNHLMLDEISSGVYLITLRNNQKILTTKMIMKE
jgi:hypothetical protein